MSRVVTVSLALAWIAGLSAPGLVDAQSRRDRLIAAARAEGIDPATIAIVEQTFREAMPELRALRRGVWTAAQLHGRDSPQAREAMRLLVARRQLVREALLARVPPAQRAAVARVLQRLRPARPDGDDGDDF